MNYIDLHCDTIMQLMQQENLALKNAPTQVNLEKLILGESLLQCFAMFVNLKQVENPFEYGMEMIDCYYKELEKNQDLIAPVFKYSDIEKNQKENKISALLTIEEGAVTKGNLSHLRNLYRLGVRMICLNWNYENGIGHPNFILTEGKKPDFQTPNTKNGLTESGLNLIKEMNRLGMIIDVSHLSDKGFYDCIANSNKPIVASHSNARAICNHVRNLTDDMIFQLHKNGGVMGINFCAAFLNDDEEIGKQTIKCAIEHMQYIKNLVGVDVISIGSDFDGINPDIELKDAAGMQKLFEEMREANFTEEEIKKIAFKNFLRVLKANLNESFILS
ncbi:MAG: dipeptidase [Anaeroplasmataceae bacterium]|nr:dipeptidase [Anaeroplasmataceae bacterium]